MRNDGPRPSNLAAPKRGAGADEAHDLPRQALPDPEASTYIGMSQSWLRQSRVTGNPDAPPFIKIGRAVRYLRKDLDAWLEQRRRSNTCQS